MIANDSTGDAWRAKSETKAFLCKHKHSSAVPLGHAANQSNYLLDSQIYAIGSMKRLQIMICFACE